jgi:hypothetical protein
MGGGGGCKISPSKGPPSLHRSVCLLDPGQPQQLDQRSAAARRQAARHGCTHVCGDNVIMQQAWLQQAASHWHRLAWQPAMPR